jgi:hypothetical protein
MVPGRTELETAQARGHVGPKTKLEVASTLLSTSEKGWFNNRGIKKRETFVFTQLPHKARRNMAVEGHAGRCSREGNVASPAKPGETKNCVPGQQL